MEEQNESVSVKQVSFKWGLISAIVSIVLFLVIYFGGLSGESWIVLVSIAITVVLMYLAHKEFKESGNGYMSYSQGLGIGTLMSVIGGAIYVVFVYVYRIYPGNDRLAANENGRPGAVGCTDRYGYGIC